VLADTGSVDMKSDPWLLQGREPDYISGIEHAGNTRRQPVGFRNNLKVARINRILSYRTAQLKLL
jgi:hypothetical protein